MLPVNVIWHTEPIYKCCLFLSRRNLNKFNPAVVSMDFYHRLEKINREIYRIQIDISEKFLKLQIALNTQDLLFYIFNHC